MLPLHTSACRSTAYRPPRSRADLSTGAITDRCLCETVYLSGSFQGSFSVVSIQSSRNFCFSQCSPPRLIFICWKVQASSGAIGVCFLGHDTDAFPPKYGMLPRDLHDYMDTIPTQCSRALMTCKKQFANSNQTYFNVAAHLYVCIALSSSAKMDLETTREARV